MSYRVITPVLLVTAAFMMGPRQSFATGPAHSALFDAISNRMQTIVAGRDFPYYSQATRIQAITDLIRSIESDYSLLLYKEHTLGLDIAKVGQAAIEAEKAIPDVYTDAEQAQGNLQFLDRVKKLVANLQDTHFSINAAEPMADVILGVGVARVRDKYVVSSIRTPLLMDPSTGRDLSKQVSLGDEVVSIDGKSPADAIAALKPFISASSDLFRADQATEALTLRDFALPDRAAASIVLRHGGATAQLALPWYALLVRRTDQSIYFQNHGVAIFTPETARAGRAGMHAQSIDTDSLFQNEDWPLRVDGLENQADFVDVNDPSSVAVSVGILNGPSGPAGYLQIRSFAIDHLTDFSTGNAPSGMRLATAQASVRAQMARIMAAPHVFAFTDVVKSLIYSMKKNSLPLILDLRNNPGGNLEYAEEFFADLVETGKRYSPLSAMFRLTMLSWESEDAATLKGMKDPKAIDFQKKMDAAFRDAIAQHRDYSEVLPDDDVTADSDLGGYDGKIVALISPNCVSACDALALLLKSSGRATLLGRATNGTGAGMFSSFAIPPWTDTNHILVAQVPNMLFGRPLKPGESRLAVSIEEIEAENRPTQPDVPYETTINDVLSGNSDLIRAALSRLPAPRQNRSTLRNRWQGI